MKKFVFEFFRRGTVACGLGPVILVAVYLILRQTTGVEMLGVSEVCIGILSLTALAFVAGGMNAVYQIERLPLMAAISIHGGVLYVSYLLTYLLNGWLESGIMPILVFTGIFAVGYLVIWAVIYCIIRQKTEQLNQLLKEKQQINGALPG